MSDQEKQVKTDILTSLENVDDFALGTDNAQVSSTAKAAVRQAQADVDTPETAMPRVFDAVNADKFDEENFKRLLEGGGKLTEKEVRALVDHMVKLNNASSLNAGLGIFINAQLTENRELILQKAQEVLGKIAELLKALFDVYYGTAETAEEKTQDEKEEQKSSAEKAKEMMESVAGTRFK